MNGAINWRKTAWYSLAIMLLIGANFLRLDRSTEQVNDVSIAQSAAPGSVFPQLFVARDFDRIQGDSPRDLFHRSDVSLPAPTVQQPATQAPPRIDPNAIALSNAQKLIDSIVVLGILGTEDGPVAVIEFDQEVKSAKQGQRIAAGVTISELTLSYLVVRNELLGLEKKIVVSE